MLSLIVLTLSALAPPKLEPLPYRNPGLVTDLNVGLYAFPLPIDWDGDGDLDLVVGCPDKPHNGIWLFENPGPKGAKHPVFKAPRRLGGPAREYLTLSWVNGRPRVLAKNQEFTRFREGDWTTTKPVYPTDRLAPIKNLRSNSWRFVDYDGDGVHDLLVGHDSWDHFGSFGTNDWWKDYDTSGRWSGGGLRGQVYWVKNDGTDAEPRWGRVEPLFAGGRAVETYGAPTPNLADFDGDGDLDLVCGEFLDGFTYYRNDGSRAVPLFAKGVRLPFTMDLQMIVPQAVDWDGDGDVDLVVGDEDGRVALVENAGRVKDGLPEFLPPRYFRQEAGDLDAGALATPSGVDWDGDGDEDILCGNTAGELLYFENLSGPRVAEPRWAAPRRLEVDGAPFRIMAGPNGSIQGPAEAKWGYTTLTAADWDADGLPDVVLNSIWGRVVWLRNVGTRTAPKLAAPRPVEVAWPGTPPKPRWVWWTPEPRTLATQWRTTPVVTDWTGDGLPDLLMLDAEGFLALFERRRTPAGLELLPPRRALLNESGQPLRLNAAEGGRSGRRKLCVVDWDGDGRPDVLLNGRNADVWRQVDRRDASWVFHNLGAVSDRNIEGHDTSPTTVDWDGDGVRDLLIGAEDGRLYYLKNPR